MLRWGVPDIVSNFGPQTFISVNWFRGFDWLITRFPLVDCKIYIKSEVGDVFGDKFLNLQSCWFSGNINEVDLHKRRQYIVLYRSRMFWHIMFTGIVHKKGVVDSAKILRKLISIKDLNLIQSYLHIIIYFVVYILSNSL